MRTLSPSTPFPLMNSSPSTPFPLMNSSPSTPYTPMNSSPSTPFPSMNSPLPLNVGRSFYRKRGNLYLKNSGTQRKSHEQTKVNQLLQYRQSNVAGILQENVSSLKKNLHLSNPQILPSQRGTIAVAEHMGHWCQPQSYPLCTKMPTEL